MTSLPQFGTSGYEQIDNWRSQSLPPIHVIAKRSGEANRTQVDVTMPALFSRLHTWASIDTPVTTDIFLSALSERCLTPISITKSCLEPIYFETRQEQLHNYAKYLDKLIFTRYLVKNT